MGMGCGVAAAGPTDSSTTKDTAPEKPRQTKPKPKTASKPRTATDGPPATARDAVDKVGAKLRTAVHDALDSVDFSRPGTKAPPKHAARTVQRLLPGPDKAGKQPRLAAVTDDDPEVGKAEPSEPKAPIAVNVEAITAIPTSALTSGVRALPALAPDPGPKVPAPAKIEKFEDAVTGAVSTVIDTVLNPFSLNSTPGAPADPPGAWAMLAFARREFEHVLRQPQDLLTQVSTLTTAVTTAPGPVALAPGIVVPPELADHVIATPGPSLTDQITVFGLEALKQVSQVIGVNITMKLGELITTPTPPWFTTIGLTVTKETYEGGDVWVITPPNPTGERVIAVHGSGFVYDPNIIHWMDYTQMARETGATIVVPRYPLIPDGGNAQNSVPPMADFIAAQVEEYGAENVSVYADSAGANLSILAVQKIVRDCNGDSECLETRVPSRMVLLSPGLEGEAAYTDPNVALVNDPVVWLTEEDKEYYGSWAAGPDELWNPMIGPTEGMPPTTIYVGSREQAAPGALLYAERMVDADPNADVTVVIGMGQIHDWAQGGPIPINSQSANYRDDVYRQLGINDDADETTSL
ncbi:alpha/beta hydrolase fold domain-containing protein [Mycolicibacterium septicum]|uniref:alpha/beta hydrolase fold domain-containing protein n=1 Tax=Mycolicibacterium septicum TaxID=98668 RepID=UPI00235FC5EB|nr:alpha/beta hydrolase fold domain-containing protein [Mycolicibacterium septicum]